MIINRAIRQMFGFIYEPGATLGRRIVGGNECAASATRKIKESMTNGIHLRQTIYRRYSDDRNGPRPLPHYAAAFNYYQLIHYTVFQCPVRATSY